MTTNEHVVYSLFWAWAWYLYYVPTKKMLCMKKYVSYVCGVIYKEAGSDMTGKTQNRCNIVNTCAISAIYVSQEMWPRVPLSFTCSWLHHMHYKQNRVHMTGKIPMSRLVCRNVINLGVFRFQIHSNPTFGLQDCQDLKSLKHRILKSQGGG